MLESFHGAFDSGKLDRILSESMLVRFGGSWECFSRYVLVMIPARWPSALADLGVMFLVIFCVASG